jgi:hypothetical protein
MLNARHLRKRAGHVGLLDANHFPSKLLVRDAAA